MSNTLLSTQFYVSTMDHPAVLSDIVEEAKAGESATELYGNCPHNARRVYEISKQYGYNPTLVRGAYSRSGIAPETIAEAEERGIVHWWTIVKIDGNEWLIDLSSETPANLMETLITDTLPETYTEFERNPLKPALDISL